MAQLTVRDLSLGYDGREIAEGIRFSVSAGDYLCITGENGAGKSTLMKTLLGLMPPLSGEILTGDGLSRGEIGYLPQQSPVQKDFPASVWEVVLSGCQGRCGFRPFYRKEEKQLAAENIRRMKLNSLQNRCYRELSGGQQQRVLLARALCAAKRMLLLDEPVSGLDPVMTAEMYHLVKELNQEGITILMISHHMEGVMDYASHVLHLGKTVFFGTKEEFLLSAQGRLFMDREGI